MNESACSCQTEAEPTTELEAEAAEAVTSDPVLLAALAAVAEHAAKQDDDEEPDDDEDDAAAAAEEFAADAPELEAAPVDGEADAARPTQYRWDAVFAPEGVATDDGRMFWPGSISWREMPLSLMAMIETSEGGHVGAQLAGRTDKIWRDGSLIRASGVFDDGDYGSEIARLVGDRTLTGLSVDIAAREYEIVPRAQLFDEDGNLRPDALDPKEGDDAEEPDLLDLLFGGEDMMFVVTDGVIGCATVCPFPAFADASISLAAAAPLVWTATLPGRFTVTRVDADAPDPTEGMTASAAGMAPVEPPREWFDPPELDELTPLTIDDAGRVSGHAWGWDSCHTGFADSCVTAPRSNTNYAYFHLAEVVTAEGDRVATGKITLATSHADRRLGRAETTEHYDHTGTAVVDVVVGEDEFGGWVAGALRPDVPAERVRELRGSVLSGDWRNVNGNLELVALLAVNVPGFPVPRARALVAAGENGEEQVLTLIAAGISGLAEFGAIKTHSTKVVDGTWDGPAAVADAPNDAAALKWMHAWVDSSGDPDAKASYKFPHHAGKVGAPANIAGVRNALARLSGADIPDGDRSGVQAHLDRHMADWKKANGGDGENSAEPVDLSLLRALRARARGGIEGLAQLARGEAA